MRVRQNSLINKYLDTPEIKDLFYSQYTAQKDLRQVLYKAIRDKYLSAVQSSESNKYSTDANWALSQADHMGYRRALKEVLALLDLGDDVDKDSHDRLVHTGTAEASGTS